MCELCAFRVVPPSEPDCLDNQTFANIVETGDAAAGTSTSYTIAVGDTFQGSIGTLGDRDWVRVTLTAGEFYSISLDGATLSDPYLRVYDANGNLIASNDDGGAGLNSLLSNFTVASSGIYYLAAGAYNDGYTGTYQLGITAGSPNLPVFTHDQIADQLTNGYWESVGAGSARAFNVAPGGSISVNIANLTADGQTLALAALEAWTNVLGITFTVTTGVAQITFDDNQSGAFASSSVSGGTILSSEVNISTAWLASYGTSLNSYSFQTYIHEIGHALGLGHAGNYNGSADYGVDNNYLNDSWQATVMSYFSQDENTYVDASFAYIFSPMVADILAVQNLYGVASTIHLGNTIYGRNSNAGGYLNQFYTIGNVAMTVVDNGGVDLFDFSGTSVNQVINLNAEQASSVLGETGNLFIARGTVIENATGGSGTDQITGNAAANVLNGGAGADTLAGEGGNDLLIGGTGADALNGGANWDTADFTGSAGGVQVNLFYGVGLYNDAQGDTYTSVENVWGSEFNDIIRGTTGANILEGRGGADQLLGDAGNDILRGGGGNDILRGGAGADQIEGGSGFDVADYTDSNARVLVNLFYGNALEGHAQGDTFVSIESAFGSAFNDIMRGSTGNNALRGNGGNDTLTGDGGADLFQYADTNWGQDLITDFTDGVDLLDLRGSGLSFSSLTIAVSGGDTFVSITGLSGQAIKLDNFVGTLNASDFLF